MGQGKEGDEKMHMWEAFSRIFSQWDVETDVCMLMHCVYCPASEDKSVWGSVNLSAIIVFIYFNIN